MTVKRSVVVDEGNGMKRIKVEKAPGQVNEDRDNGRAVLRTPPLEEGPEKRANPAAVRKRSAKDTADATSELGEKKAKRIRPTVADLRGLEERVRGLTAANAELDERLGREEEKSRGLSLENVRLGNRLRVLGEDNQRLQEVARERTGIASRANAELLGRNERAESLESTLRAARKNIEDLAREKNGLEQEVGLLGTANEELRSTLNGKNREIGELNSQLMERSEEIETLRKTLETRDSQVRIFRNSLIGGAFMTIAAAALLIFSWVSSVVPKGPATNNNPPARPGMRESMHSGNSTGIFQNPIMQLTQRKLESAAASDKDAAAILRFEGKLDAGQRQAFLERLNRVLLEQEVPGKPVDWSAVKSSLGETIQN